MSTMRITATTSGQFIGHEFDSADNPIKLAPDVEIHVERTLEIPGGTRFISSNFIIDAQEV